MLDWLDGLAGPQYTRAILWTLAALVLLVVVLIGAAWSVMALSQLGISQIVSVTILGGALQALAAHGLPPLAVASGLMGAWALSTCSTPVGAVVLSIARLANVPMRVVARQWNGRFVILGALVLAAWLVLLSQLP